MIRQTALITVTLAALTTTGLATASMAQQGRGPMPEFPFDTVDADKDGRVTLAEFDAYRAAKAAEMDTDGDGKLTAAELTAGHLAQMTERAAAMSAHMIDRLDTDGDKALSTAELGARPMPAMLFERADADGDGAVTKVEADALRDKIASRMHGEGGQRGHGQHWNWGMKGEN